MSNLTSEQYARSAAQAITYSHAPSREDVATMVAKLRRKHKADYFLDFRRSPITTDGGVLLLFHCSPRSPLADPIDPVEHVAFFRWHASDVVEGYHLDWDMIA